MNVPFKAASERPWSYERGCRRDAATDEVQTPSASGVNGGRRPKMLALMVLGAILVAFILEALVVALGTEGF
jgi:hypothetical protein